MKLSIRYLGIPEVRLNDSIIPFPFKKAEVLFYYLQLENKVSREKLVDLFWGEADEASAKKNLRNAVYVIKKLLGTDIFISSKRHVIQMNDQIMIETDLDAFANLENEAAVEYYRGDFLEGIYIKDSEWVEHWIFQKRQECQAAYWDKLLEITKDNIKIKAYDKAEYYAKKLISQDVLNEEAYRLLMEIYHRQQKINKSIAVYEEVKEVLDRELSVSPDETTKALYEKLISLKRNHRIHEKKAESPVEDIFFGRERELEILKSNHFPATKGKTAKSVLITGEAGIGKSKLIEEFIKRTEDDSCAWLLSYCFKPERNEYYRPWVPIISKMTDLIKKYHIKIPEQIIMMLGNFFPSLLRIRENEFLREGINGYQHQMIENQMVQLVEIITEYIPMVIIFEDIQWMDEKSRSLFHYLLSQNNEGLYTVASLRYEASYEDEGYLYHLQAGGLVKKIELNPFDRKNTIDFSKKIWKRAVFPKEMEQRIYDETLGNTFFIKELLNHYMKTNEMGTHSVPMENAIKSRFLELSEQEMKLVNMCSLFFDKVSLMDIQQLTGKEDTELIDHLEKIQQKSILKEVVNFHDEPQEIKFIFMHQKVREYVYQSIPSFKRKVLHQKIAKMLEQKTEIVKNPEALYSRLMYHYKNAADEVNHLHYKIKNVESHLDFYHEMFPVLKYEREVTNLSWDRKRVNDELKEVHKLLVSIRKEHATQVYEEMEVKYLYTLARFQILQGLYKQGMAINRNMIRKSEKIQHPEFMLQGYKHAIYYCINIRNPEQMKTYIHKAFQVLRHYDSMNTIEEKGILMRLKGKMKMMTGDWKEAEACFHEALKLFIGLENVRPYILNIAACYSFLGECSQNRGDMRKAEAYYRKAIVICENKKLRKGLPIFYTHLGKMYFDTGEWQKAEMYLRKAIDTYTTTECLWKKSIPYACMALILLEKKEVHQATECLQKASSYVDCFQNPYEIGIYYRICYAIARKTQKDAGLMHKFLRYIPYDAAFYHEKMKENAMITCSNYELNQSESQTSTLC
ncbi:BTAD domain-containing putative transcriptional regulator [Tindallia californiensis]|nr:BTAD domain-containing putative transcriptional regulator [Tindallia californiensis]